jgi:hypothetical protein
MRVNAAEMGRLKRFLTNLGEEGEQTFSKTKAAL